MNQSMIFAIAALACAVLLLVQTKNRVWPVLAVVASGLQLLIAFGVIRLSISGISLTLVLGLALLISGVMSWLSVAGKLHVSAATVVTLIGLVMTLSGLGRW